MKKVFYFVLFLVSVGLIFVTLFFSKTPQKVETPPVATEATTTELSPSNQTVKELTTKTSKKITITDTHPSGASLSTVTLATTGFASDTSITLQSDMLADAFTTDLDGDGYDELILVAQSQGSGSYGTIFVYTTRNDLILSPIQTPEIPEGSATATGSLFYGYEGHDSFVALNGVLTRQFPTYTQATDTNATPSGEKKTLYYNLTRLGSTYSLDLIKAPRTLSDILGTSWTLDSMITNDTPLASSTFKKFSLSFSKNNKLTLTTDCNTFTSTYEATSSLPTFTNLSGTKKACTESFEPAFIDLIKTTRRFDLASSSLVLTLTNNDQLLFIKK
jgi:heat shock protein HslJ